MASSPSPQKEPPLSCFLLRSVLSLRCGKLKAEREQRKRSERRFQSAAFAPVEVPGAALSKHFEDHSGQTGSLLNAS